MQKIIEKLRERIITAKKNFEPEEYDFSSWGYQQGILLSINEASELLAASENPVSGEGKSLDEIRDAIAKEEVNDIWINVLRGLSKGKITITQFLEMDDKANKIYVAQSHREISDEDRNELHSAIAHGIMESNADVNQIKIAVQNVINYLNRTS